jgi:hypothetical protein
MTLCGNTALLLFYSFVIGMDQNSLLISYEKRRKLSKFIKVMLCVSLICLIKHNTQTEIKFILNNV